MPASLNRNRVVAARNRAGVLDEGHQLIVITAVLKREGQLDLRVILARHAGIFSIDASVNADNEETGREALCDLSRARKTAGLRVGILRGRSLSGEHALYHCGNNFVVQRHFVVNLDLHEEHSIRGNNAVVRRLVVEALGGDHLRDCKTVSDLASQGANRLVN